MSATRLGCKGDPDKRSQKVNVWETVARPSPEICVADPGPRPVGVWSIDSILAPGKSALKGRGSEPLCFPRRGPAEGSWADASKEILGFGTESGKFQVVSVVNARVGVHLVETD